MEAASGKGTVLPLASVVPAEEAIKASQRVHETIIEKQKELDTVHNFAADNTSLINLVQRLPDELHHQIIVPFGTAAFFPGRLVHTNEFTVFLGENYYAERTAKQTIDILSRRGKTLESHVDSLKDMIKQLKTQASFFERTAQEAEEGLVEIREELSDEDSVEADSISGKLDAPRPSEEGNGGGGRGAYDDEENALVWSKFEELEREELERGDNSEDDESEDTKESEDDEHEDFEKPEADDHGDSEEEDEDEYEDNEESEYDQNDESSDNLLGNLIKRSQNRDESSLGKDMMQTKALMLNKEDYVSPSILKTRSQSSPKSKQVSFQIPEPEGGSRIAGPVTKSLKAPVQMPKSDAGSQLSRTKPDADALKAFSGTIVERTDNLPLKPEKQTTSQPSNSQSSRPVSRFKMQRMAQGLN